MTFLFTFAKVFNFFKRLLQLSSSPCFDSVKLARRAASYVGLTLSMNGESGVDWNNGEDEIIQDSPDSCTGYSSVDFHGAM